MRSTDARLAALVAAIFLSALTPRAARAAATVSPATSTLTLEWTAPGDDGQVGVASRYELRYSTDPITAANFTSAMLVNDVPHPQPAGKREKVKVRGLEPLTVYYFAVRSVDEAGNWSRLSNVAIKTAPDPATAPAQFSTALSSPWPCPARSLVRNEMTLAEPTVVHVQVFDVAGRRVKTLAEGEYPAGTSMLDWNLRDEGGAKLAIGSYWIIGVLGDRTVRHRLTIVP